MAGSVIAPAHPDASAAEAIRPHDLIRLGAPSQLVDDSPRPAWLHASLVRAPWVVVRRAAARDGLVPVGIRGATREQRRASWLPASCVASCITPEELARRREWRGHPRTDSVPALRALDRAAELLDSAGLAWGPAGSVGFELATGVPTATPLSDLDLVIRLQLPFCDLRARSTFASLQRLPAKLDVLIETAAGALSLAEVLGPSPSLVLRTTDGPRLIERSAIEGPRVTS
jgi:phosphoribosyl-dephospho-CoA transferase